MEFSKRLKELRKDKNLTLEELSKEINGKISPSAMGLWERGQRTPNLDAVIVLAKYFNVSLDYIAGLVD